MAVSAVKRRVSRDDTALDHLDKRPRVLVVDDNPIDRRIASHIAQVHFGARVQCACNGLKALAAIDEEPPDVILTDLFMPEMDGLQFIKAVRRSHQAIPIILMTSSGSDDLAMLALRLGATIYVPKKNIQNDLPWSLKQVLANLEADRQQNRLMDSLVQWESSFVLENDPEMVRFAAAHVQSHMVRMGLFARNRVRVTIALQEAMLLALFHGNLELDVASSQKPANAGRVVKRSKQPPSAGSRRIHAHFFLSKSEARFVIVNHEDRYRFNLSKLPNIIDDANLTNSAERGLHLIRTFMDAVIFNGNEITLIKRADRLLDSASCARADGAADERESAMLLQLRSRALTCTYLRADP